MNSFELLGLPVGLLVSEEVVREAFRAKAAGVHPDSGGDAGDFGGLQVAQEVLLSPGKRLKEWLAAREIEVDSRGQIDAGLMDLFQKVAEVGSAAEEAIKAGEKAASMLTKAVAEVALMKQREAVKNLLAEVELEIRERVGEFSEIERGCADGGKVMRNLVFLEKWRATLKGLYGRLM